VIYVDNKVEYSLMIWPLQLRRADFHQFCTTSCQHNNRGDRAPFYDRNGVLVAYIYGTKKLSQVRHYALRVGFLIESLHTSGDPVGIW